MMSFMLNWQYHCNSGSLQQLAAADMHGCECCSGHNTSLLSCDVALSAWLGLTCTAGAHCGIAAHHRHAARQIMAW